mgnify:CR=1 FL=1
MKITKAQLKQIIKEELSTLPEERVEEDPKDALEGGESRRRGADQQHF